MKLALISSGFESRTSRLQPHRTLLEMGKQLVRQGHDVTLITDRASGTGQACELEGLPLCKVASVNLHPRRNNNELCDTLKTIGPDLVLWHLSLSSFLHQSFTHPYAARTIGVVTSPVYDFGEALRLGLGKLSSNPELIATHLIGTLVPDALVLRALDGSHLRGIITLSERTRDYFLKKGAPADRLWVVPPGVDRTWLDALIGETERDDIRRMLGFERENFVVAYFGSPAPVRGLSTTLRAVEAAAHEHPEIGMVVLSRRRGNEWEKQAAKLDRLIARDGLRDRVTVVDGFLEQGELIRYIQASDVVCLPFELVPSDVPLSILESMALGKPVIGTQVACIPELLGDGRGFLVPPASADALARQITRLAGQREAAEARGRAGRAYVDAQRTWDDMGQRLGEVLDDVCGK
jgi:glycosyltransferase involved in cell wall biosynthesis